MAYKGVDWASIGADKPVKSPEQQQDSANGTYKDAVAEKPTESLLPLKEFPLAPPPKPYK